MRVRRVAEGDDVVLFDGRGGNMLGRLVRADPSAARVALVGPYPDRTPQRDVVIAVSLPEPGRADALVAVLAELGVRRLIPLLCERTPKGREALPERRRKRWERAAREAAKVNGSARLLEVGRSATFDAVLREAPACLLLDPDPRAQRLADHRPAVGDLPWLLVGPEGGFTEAETRAADDAGARRVRLGTAALRTGTAAAAAAAVLLA